MRLHRPNRQQESGSIERRQSLFLSSVFMAVADAVFGRDSTAAISIVSWVNLIGMNTPTPTSIIDRSKLRAAIRKIGDERAFYMLYEAIDLLPEAELAALVARYIPADSLRGEPRSDQSLLQDVQTFDAAARRGDYYVSFHVNYRNSADVSKGTRAFIAECCRLLDRCVAEANKENTEGARVAMDVIFALLSAVNDANDDIVFFADEGGVWMFGIDWPTVLQAWCKCLSQACTPVDYARRTTDAFDQFDKIRRTEHIKAASRLATASQRDALVDLLKAANQ